MRGSPLLRALLVLIALAALVVPLRKMTSEQVPLPVQPRKNSERSVPNKRIHLELTCTTSPFRYQVAYSGQTIWNGYEAAATAKTDLDLAFPIEGIDLVLDVSWEENRPTAVRLVVKPSNEEETSETAWGTTNVSEVVTIKPSK
ncbi:MAG: hypothetical protein WB586_10290 [Chthoniobacterales bacterium]